MSAIRRKIIRVNIYIAIILYGSIIYGQVNQVDSSSAVNMPVDTSDYLPLYYSGALESNLMIAASKGYPTEIDRLISMGADVNAETTQGATPLVFAVNNNRLAAVKALLKYKPILDNITLSYETPLLIAVKNDFFDISEALIRAGADINFRDRYGATPLHYASLYGYFDVSDLLLYYDASIDLKSDEGTTPLLAAIWAGNTDVADLLVQNGAALDTKDNDGITPFLMAAFYGDTLMMDILFKKGANIYVTDNIHRNAMDISLLTGQKIAVDFLFRISKKWANTGNNAVDLYKITAKNPRPDLVTTLKDNNIPGNVKYKIDQVALSVSSRFFIHDIYTGISLSFKEPYLNAGFILGCDLKLWYTRVLIKKSENLFYQYLDKGSVAYAGIYKDFALTDHPNKLNFSLSPSLLAGYSFGNSLKGTLMVAGNKFLIIPGATFKMTKINFSLNTGVEYVKSEFYHTGPIWLRMGLTYNYFFDNLRKPVKPIKWY